MHAYNVHHVNYIITIEKNHGKTPTHLLSYLQLDGSCLLK